MDIALDNDNSILLDGRRIAGLWARSDGYWYLEDVPRKYRNEHTTTRGYLSVSGALHALLAEVHEAEAVAGRWGEAGVTDTLRA